MTTTLGELATLVRSKNAGPFWVTIDIFLPDTPSYDRATRSPVTDVQTIGTLLGIDDAHIRVFKLPALHAIKISFPRPVTQGARRDRDMHAGQQYVPLLAMQVA